jgi:hypothetical protein
MARKRETIDRFNELEVLSFPFRFGNLVLIIVYTLVYTYLTTVWSILGAGGIALTASLTYVTALFFIGYLFVIVDYTALGYQEIPKLSKNLLESEKARLFKEMILLSFFLSLMFVIDELYWRLFIAIASLVLFPLATSVVLLEEKLMSAFNPLKWLAMLQDINSDKVFYRFLTIEGLLISVVYLTLVWDLGFIGIAVTLVLAIMLFRSLGVVLHSNADALGILVQFGKQIEAAQEAEIVQQEIHEEALALYRMATSGNTADALERLRKRLAADHYSTEADFFAQIRTWEDPQLAIIAGQDYIPRLARRGELKLALGILEFCYQANKQQFKLGNAGLIFELAEQAETRAHREIIAHLLAHLPDDFPGHPRSGEALLSAARITASDLDDFDTSTVLLDRIRKSYEEQRRDPEYRQLRRIVKKG